MSSSTAKSQWCVISVFTMQEIKTQHCIYYKRLHNITSLRSRLLKSRVAIAIQR